MPHGDAAAPQLLGHEVGGDELTQVAEVDRATGRGAGRDRDRVALAGVAYGVVRRARHPVDGMPCCPPRAIAARLSGAHVGVGAVPRGGSDAVRVRAARPAAHPRVQLAGPVSRGRSPARRGSRVPLALNCHHGWKSRLRCWRPRPGPECRAALLPAWSRRPVTPSTGSARLCRNARRSCCATWPRCRSSDMVMLDGERLLVPAARRGARPSSVAAGVASRRRRGRELRALALGGARTWSAARPTRPDAGDLGHPPPRRGAQLRRQPPRAARSSCCAPARATCSGSGPTRGRCPGSRGERGAGRGDGEPAAGPGRSTRRARSTRRPTRWRPAPGWASRSG